MRCVTRIGPALLGLALAGPTAAWADNCPSCQQEHRHRSRPIRICESCMRAQQQANGGRPVPPPMMVPGAGGCAACQAQAAPGVTMWPRPVMLDGQAPGYAVAGGTIPSAEPAPIGVMQASYNHQAGGPTAAMAPGRASVGGPAAGAYDPSLQPGGSPGFLNPPRHHRPNVLGHLIGLRRFETRQDRMRREARARHAAVPYGPNGELVSELPSSMVYGR